mmetsp:Transcript_28061/g.52417  ORF Transcript_28061/g.52417 Transcript_28061/m.52417 type:complete len:91 (+) Transcript_28061:102-374(+)
MSKVSERIDMLCAATSYHVDALRKMNAMSTSALIRCLFSITHFASVVISKPAKLSFSESLQQLFSHLFLDLLTVFIHAIHIIHASNSGIS